MPAKLIDFSKDALIVGFRNMYNLDRIEDYIVKKLEEREGGHWICLIHVHDKVFRLSYKAPKELYMTIEKDNLKVIIAQTKE